MRLNKQAGIPAADVAKDFRLPKGFSAIGDRRYSKFRSRICSAHSGCLILYSVLRPEAIESVFILYRTTGEEHFLEAAWEMFMSIVSATQTPIANAALADITYTKEELAGQGAQVQMDSMESFWMAETLKYFYLIFSEPDLISLDEWVFNTEAHPFKRALP